MFTFDSNAPTSPSYFQKKKIQEQEQQQCGVTDEAEPFMGSGRFGNHNLLSFIPFYHLFYMFMIFRNSFHIISL